MCYRTRIRFSLYAGAWQLACQAVRRNSLDASIPKMRPSVPTLMAVNLKWHPVVPGLSLALRVGGCSHGACVQHFRQPQSSEIVENMSEIMRHNCRQPDAFPTLWWCGSKPTHTHSLFNAKKSLQCIHHQRFAIVEIIAQTTPSSFTHA